MDNMNVLTQQLGNILTECLERGMQLPFTTAVLALNGSLLAVRYVPADDGEGCQCEVLAERSVGGSFRLPINIMVVDANGDAARILIGQSGETTFH